MSDARGAEPRSELEVARVGGGPSPRVGALVVVGVLVGVVWAGVSGRPANPLGTLESTRPAIAAPTSEPTGAPVAIESVSPRPTAARNAYSVSATIGNTRYIAPLEELRTNHVTAILRVPLPVDETSGTLTITEVWSKDRYDHSALVGDWSLPLGPLFSTRTESELVIDAAMPTRPNRSGASPAVRGGFTLNVWAQNDLLFGLLYIELMLNDVPHPVAAASAASDD